MTQTDQKRVLDNHASFQELVATAERYLKQDRPDVAAVYAQVSAKYAAGHHPGMFASQRLESLLGSIARTLDQPTPSVPDHSSKNGNFPERVLHILTQVAGIGGHTRMLWRWIENDLERSHSVAITRQGSAQIPAMLTGCVQASGGNFHILDHAPGNLLKRANRLRRAAADYDLIVLHIDPDDVVPLIAFAGDSKRPPVVYVNHADQFFWLGVSISDIVANLRETGASHAISRRGVTRDRCAMLPIPLSPVQRSMTRFQAKQLIGAPSDGTLLVSIARPHKYAATDGVAFVDALRPVVERYQDVSVLVVGATEDASWIAASESTGGRLRTLGLRADTTPFYQAADIYVDSYPVVSITSLLEAGSYGLPLVSRHSDGTGNTILSADTPALSKHMLAADSPGAFTAQLVDLIENRARRTQVGDEIQRDILEVHAGTSWKKSLLDMYAQASSGPRGRVWSVPADECLLEIEDTLLPRLFPREPGRIQVLQYNLRLFPAGLRCRLWFKVLSSNRSFHPGLLLSQPTADRLEKWLARAGNGRRLAAGVRR